MYRNRRLSRAPAAFVAVLYVFLSTFGTLTHTHAWFGEEADEPTAAITSESRLQIGNAPTRVFGRYGAGAPTHCAFCDWQANSVSVALPIQHCNLPRVIALAAPCLVAISIPVRGVETSSRAPPPA